MRKKFLYFCIVFMVVFAFPFIHALINKPDGFEFSGELGQNIGDSNVYFSQMEQARQGHVSFYNLFTSQRHNPVLVNPVWLLLGGISRITHVSVPVVFHLARIVLIPFLCLALFRLANELFSDTRVRNTAILMALFSGGWMNYAYTTDASVFNGILFSPHIALSLILLCFVLRYSMRAFSGGSRKNSIIAGLLSAALYSFHPYQVATLFFIIGTLTVVNLLRRTTTLRSVIWLLSSLSIPALIATLYYRWMFKTLPFGAVWLQQSDTLMRVRGILELLFDFLPLFVFGIAGIVAALKQRDRSARVLIPWIAASYIGMIVPWFFRMRMSGGLQIALSFAAAYALIHFVPKWPIVYRTMVVVGFVVSLSVFQYVHVIRSASYIPNDAVAIMREFRDVSAINESILAPGRYGNIIPAFTGRRAYSGHAIMTPDADNARLNTERFYATDTFNNDRARLLRDNSISYVFCTPEHCGSNGFEPQTMDVLQPVLFNNGYSVYRVAIQ